jgi:NAD-dependent SIR2 family protein deacetylase
MTIRQFTSDPVFRQRYWARNHVGWRHMDDTLPNAGHRALAALEHAGVVSGVITQNVDLLHTKAGSANVVNLHGTYTQVICLDCGHTMSRAALAEQLEAMNPGFIERAEAIGGLAVAPDADAVVADTAWFRYLDCPRCAGMLKPDIVYFGENVPKRIVAQGYSLVDEAQALLVAGSSLTVFSGYRFVRHAAAHPDRHRQPRPHPRRRPGHGQGRRRMLRIADAVGHRVGGDGHALERAGMPRMAWMKLPGT